MREYFLETDRLMFSVWNENDESHARELWGEKEVTKYISATGIFTDEEIIRRLHTEIESYEKYKIQYFPVFLKETGELAGCCGVRPKDTDTFEFGIHLKSKFHNRGYGYEAGEAIINYVFSAFDVVKLFAGHNPRNVNSKKLLLKLGFIYTHDEFYAPTGLMHPSYIKNKS